MEQLQKIQLKHFLQTHLAEHGDHDALEENQLLFSSGRLDSLTMTRLVVFLEQQFSVDFSAVSFDVDLMDSIAAIESFVDAQQSSR